MKRLLKNRITPFWILGLLLCVPFFAFSQYKLSSALLKADTSSVESPGIRAGRIAVVDEERSRSTGLAMGLSALLPGAGQVYVQRYWTIPVIWGFGYYFSRLYFKSADLYKDYRDQYGRSVLADTAGVGNTFLRDVRDFYRDERDRFAIYMALTYVLNIIDAYVGASLYGFDVSDNLGGQATVKLRLPVR
ncbi:MAG: DUF5683 domain-containing protein [Bacteroidota bacterium]